MRQTLATPSRTHTPAPRGFLGPVYLASLCLALLLVAGCSAAGRLKVDYTNYEDIYALTSNREMLLNLARLDQHDPTYFFKLGQIATSYQMSAGLSGNGQYMIQGTGAGGNAIGGGTPTLFYQKNPSFQFIPVNDDTTAQQLLKPIDPLIFYNLYQQGWRVDQLFRLMVDRIEFRQPGGKYWEVIRNSPTLDNAENYARFLRVSAIAYEMQKRGFLRLQGKEMFVPVPGSAVTAAPAAKDVLDAQAKNLIWRQDDKNQWHLEQDNVVGVFNLNEPMSAGQTQAAADAALNADIDADMPELSKGGLAGQTVQQIFIQVLKDGFTVQESYDSTDVADQKKFSCQIVMRSLIGVMAAAAQEQDDFNQFMTKNPPIPAPTAADPNATLPFTDVVPSVEQQPVLRLKWAGADQTVPKLVQITYRNATYSVTDYSVAPPANPGADLDWNRDVFRLLTQLTAQVTVDISKFPLPSILQLNTQ
ncbi:MAG: hypothetical protein WA871_07865 [Candidatus Acidiferrales bacterium]